MPDHGHTGTGGTNDGLGRFKNLNEPFSGNAGLLPIPAIESRLPAASLPGRAGEIDSKAAKNSDHGFADFRVDAVDQALDEQGYGVCRTHGYAPQSGMAGIED